MASEGVYIYIHRENQIDQTNEKQKGNYNENELVFF